MSQTHRICNAQNKIFSKMHYETDPKDLHDIKYIVKHEISLKDLHDSQKDI